MMAGKEGSIGWESTGREQRFERDHQVTSVEETEAAS